MLMLMLVPAGAAILAPASALARESTAASNSTTFTDSTGENPNAPDITTIVVSNNDAGLITFKVNISNRPALTADMTVLAFLNTDQKASTGDSNNDGAEYLLELDPGALTLYHWNGSDYATASSQTSVTFSYDATGATMRATAADLGNIKAFNFYALAISGLATDASGNPDFSNANGDSAPDAGHGAFTYKVLRTLTLSVAAFTTSPSPAKAGKTFVANLAANESDTGGPAGSGTVACSATVAGKHLTAKLHSVANGIATCAWSLSKGVKGTLKGTVTLTVKGKTVARSFTVKVS